MHIRKVTAHAFGPLSGQTLEFADGMTVIAGDNESAKSSWHAAIYAALCGRRRARGAPRRQEQSFIDLHKPWDGGDWLVSGEVVLDDGRRIELRQDLAGKVDCHAKDLDVGRDVSAEVMNDGAPDGARWLGLDRSSFMATACVEQAQMLRVLADADGLQSHLQRAADTAGADFTAASALSLIDEFERDRVGRDWISSAKPLRRAMDAVQDGGKRLEAARQAHEEYLRLAAETDRLRGGAESAKARVLAHEAAAARHEADELDRQMSRAKELRAALGDAPPAPAADDEALTRRAAQAVARWQARPLEPVLTAPTAAQLEAEIDALPAMPDGDTQVHGSVAEARTALECAEAKLAQLEADQPSVPDTPAAAASASDQELLDLAHVLEAPVPGVDPALEAAAEAARRDLDAARSYGRVAAGLLAAAGVAVVVAVALLASHSAGAGAMVLVLAAVLAVLGVARRRGASSGDAQRRHAEAGARIDAARQQVADAARRRDAAARRCRELGLDPNPRVIRQAVADRARQLVTGPTWLTGRAASPICEIRSGQPPRNCCVPCRPVVTLRRRPRQMTWQLRSPSTGRRAIAVPGRRGKPAGERTWPPSLRHASSTSAGPVQTGGNVRPRRPWWPGLLRRAGCPPGLPRPRLPAWRSGWYSARKPRRRPTRPGSKPPIWRHC